MMKDVHRVLPPLEPIAIYGIGLNYAKHAQETNLDLPKFPVYFMKSPDSVTGHEQPIVIPRVAASPPEVDYEGELAVVIGKPCKNATAAEAMNYVLGFTIANDVSARRWQVDVSSLRLTTRVNGEVMQDSNTSDMIFSVPEIIEFLSQDTTLPSGSVILTGTPEGVGFTRKPPVFLKHGDVVEVEIEGIGLLRNHVVSQDE
ncbi:unnamed protein product [Symbiodinium sp. KB8]|nr:unnamed protein product [Symbiodinium sp. KB8]